MRRLYRCLPPILFLICAIVLCGKLLLTPVAGRVTQTQHYVRGWPWVYSEFRGTDESPPGIFTDLGGSSTRFQVPMLLADIATMFVILIFLAALSLWRRRRRGNLFQFSLRGMFVFVALCACLLGWWSKIYADWKREQEILTQWNQGSAMSWGWVSCGPEWLRRLLPWNHPDIFRRATYFSVKHEDYVQRAFEEKLPLAIKDLRLLRHLSFDVGAPKPVHLRDPTALSHVEEMSFDARAVDDDTLKWVGKLTDLKELSVGGFIVSDDAVANVSDDGLASLRTCISLESLRVTKSKSAGIGFSRLCGLPNLRQLSLALFHATTRSLTAIAEIKSLDSIRLTRCEFADLDAFTPLASLPRLRSLALEEGRLSLDQIKSLTTCRGIRELSLAGCQGVTDQSIEALKTLQLRVLHLTDCTQVSDHATETLNQMPDLEILHLEGCSSISEAGILRLREKPLWKEIKVRPGQFSSETLDTLHRRVSNLWVW
jgi:hypothetical protein